LLFNSELPSNAVAVLRALFWLDCVRADAVEAALLSHSGQGALNLEVQADA
jgi:hypothetical protein